MEGLQRGIEECYSEEVVLGRMLGYVGRIERRVGTAPSVSMSMSAADEGRGWGGGSGPGEMEVMEVMEDSRGEEHDLVVEKMQSTLRMRKDAVDLLAQAVEDMAEGMNDSEEEVRAFEKRVDVIKDRMAKVVD